MTTLHYTAELSFRQAALLGEAELARQARRSRRRSPAFRMRHGTSGRTSLASPPGQVLGS